MHRSRSAHAASPSAVMQAVVSACRGQLLGQWGHTQTRDRDRLNVMVGRPEAAANTLHDTRRVHYLSMEFLMGRAMGNAIAAMGLQAQAEKALAPSGTHLGALLEGEGDAALATVAWVAWPLAFGFNGRTGPACVRLWLALPVRHVRAANRRGRAAGTAGRLDARWQPLGGATPRAAIPRGLWWPGERRRWSTRWHPPAQAQA